MTDAFDELMLEAFGPNPNLVQPDEPVNVSLRQQAAFWATEAILQLGTSWHCEEALYTGLQDKHPWFRDFEGTIAMKVRSVLKEKGTLVALDFMYELEQFVVDAADAVAQWLVRHGIVHHMHAWVYLTNIGFTPVSIGMGPDEHAWVILPLPADRGPFILGKPPTAHS